MIFNFIKELWRNFGISNHCSVFLYQRHTAMRTLT